MQLSIMNKVKNGELTIEDALHQAERERKQLLQHRGEAEEVQEQRKTTNTSQLFKKSLLDCFD